MKKHSNNKKNNFLRIILLWRRRNNFDSQYPWRNTKNRYRILLSELLLKKTTRTQVAGEWKNIIKQCNSFEGIQKCNLKKLKKTLRPLGLENTRSKNLKELSKIILKKYKGKVPDKKSDLMFLPGVGPYTANAVLCFAFGHDVSMLDTNITRVLKRVFGYRTKKSRERIDKSLWEFAESLPPKGKAKEFNYAILDFASDVCSAKNPKCDACPARKICAYASSQSELKKFSHSSSTQYPA